MTRLIMTAVVILVVVGVVLAAAGVLRLQNTRDEAGITIDKKELKEKTHEAVEKTREAGGRILDKTGETLHKAAQRMQGSSDDRSETSTTPTADQQSTRPLDASKHPPVHGEHPSDRAPAQ